MVVDGLRIFWFRDDWVNREGPGIRSGGLRALQAEPERNTAVRKRAPSAG